MRSTRSKPPLRHLFVGAGLTLAALCAAPLHAQELSPVVSSEFSLSGNEAALQLELQGGRTLDLALRRGVAYVDGRAIGDAPRGSPLDRQWRELLARAMDAAPDELPQLLFGWSADAGTIGTRFEGALDAALLAQEAAADAITAQAVGVAPNSDSVARLVERIGELEQMVDRLESRRERVVVERPARSRNPFRHISEGLAGIFSILVAYTVLFGIGFGVIFFGGRKYIEGVADTARHATGRSFLVGLAAAFLIVPAFVLGIIALVISVVGIPGLLVWVPGFPVAFVLALLLGYLGVAHAAGEAFAERRFYVTDWFQRGNSYYFLLSGIGILLALFLASQVVHMAGPWLRAINAILIFLGVMSTLTVVVIGFGAVLISRGGKQPVRADGSTAERDLFTEDASV
jgi:MFS family permease